MPRRNHAFYTPGSPQVVQWPTLGTGVGGAAVIPAPKGLTAKGDSLTLGQQAVGGTRDYPASLSREVGLALAANYGVSGQTLATANTNYSAEGGGGIYSASTNDTYLLMMGTNDAAVTDAATVLSRLQSHITLALATGWRIALGSIPKRGDSAPAQAVLDTVNASIRANWRSMGATWFADLDQWPTLQNTADTTYYYTDKLHFIDAGYLEVAKCFQAALGLSSLSARGSNGALRFRANPPDWDPSETLPATFVATSMQQGTMGNGSTAVLVTPITAKSVFAFKFVSGVGSFTCAGVMVSGADTTNNPGFGSGNGGAALYNNGNIFAAGGGTGSAFTIADGDTVGVDLDPIAKKIWFTKDGTSFFGVDGSTATLANVAAGANSPAQSWNGSIYAIAGGFGGGSTAVTQSVPYPWTLPSGYSQL